MLKIKNKKLIEIAVVTLLTVIAAFLSFFRLGSTVAPGSSYSASRDNEVVVSVGNASVDTLCYYTGIQESENRKISVFGLDGESSKLICQKAVGNGDMYRWNRLDVTPAYTYYKLVFTGTGALSDVTLRDTGGNELSSSSFEIYANSPGLSGYSSSEKVWNNGDYIVFKTAVKDDNNNKSAVALSTISVSASGSGGVKVFASDISSFPSQKLLSETALNASGITECNARAEFFEYRIEFGEGMNVIELAFIKDNVHIPVEILDSYDSGDEDVTAVFDEQELFPEFTDYENGMIFDEIYFARTAYEFINEINPVYEWTHPHLGKVIMTVGIELFGMNPFGWRCVSALFSVLIVPLSYALGRVLFNRVKYATVFATLMLLDGMRIVQGRIGTVDSFLVFFILASYLFMFLFYKNSFNRHGAHKWLLPLALSGIFFGCAASVKWSGIYAGIGLFIIFLYVMIKRLIGYVRACKDIKKSALEGEVLEFAKKIKKFAIPKAISCVLTAFICFILIPLVIYIGAYVPHAKCNGIEDVNVLGAVGEVFSVNLPSMEEGDSLSLALKEANEDKSEFFRMWIGVQGSIFDYHSKLDATHAYSSPWYMWPVSARPVYFYYGDVAFGGMYARIYSGGVHAITVVATFAVLYYLINRVLAIFDERKGALPQEGERNRRMVGFFALIGIVANFVPWIFISRCTFNYHYYPTLPFTLVFTVLLFMGYEEHSKGKTFSFPRLTRRGERLVVSRHATLLLGYFAVVIINFLIMYPVLTGLPIPRDLAWLLFGWTGSV